MAIRKKTSTTRLPQILIQELDASTPNSHPHNLKKRGPQLSRKESRKQGRSEKKHKKAAFFAQAPDFNAKKRHAEDQHEESPRRKKPRVEERSESANFSRVANTSSDTLKPSLKTAHKSVDFSTSTLPSGGAASKSISVIKKTTTKPKVVVKTPPVKTRIEEEDETYINYLESKLGYSKGKKKGKDTEDDGLDDLLDWADAFSVPSTKGIEFSQDEFSMLNTISGSGSPKQDDNDSEGDEWGGIDHEPSEEEEEEAPDLILNELANEGKSVTGSVYVPPHLRNTKAVQDDKSEEMQKLIRQLKGLFNRMSEQNISSILDSIEDIYRNHRRNDVTSTITTLIIDGISSHSSLLDSYVVLYAALVSSLHKIIGVEFAAHFVQNVVALYERYFDTLVVDTLKNVDVEGKECSNLIVLLSELYNFQVISSVLVFDVIRGLLSDELSEFKVELLLKIVRNSGQQLRQDDPSALKDIIQIVQTKISDKNDALSSRTRFMIETLTNLKNNKLKRNTTQNQGAEAVERMKKFISGLTKKKHVLAHDALRVSLEDLHSAESKGKWWLVGAAWGGDPLVDHQRDSSATKQLEISEEPTTDLLKLARSQGMNTDIRRSIFVVLMSSDDYVDACERLSQLSLTEVQQREIVRVLLHCCGNEKSYNPYYTLVCQQLCSTSHSYKITLQFCLWDFLRDLGEKTVGGAELIKNIKDDDSFEIKNISKSRLKNVAKAYAWWISKDCVNLTILKPIDFTSLKTQTREFLRDLLLQIFIDSQVLTPSVGPNLKIVFETRNQKSVEEIFIKASRMQALAMGLVYFVTEAFKGMALTEEEGSAKFIEWAAGIAKDTLRSGVD